MSSHTPRKAITTAGQPSDVPWWKRYSRHGELPWSSGLSLACHLFLLLLIVLIPMLKILEPEDRTPPQVDSIEISDGTSGGDGDEAAEPEPDEPLAATDAFQEPMPQAAPVADLAEVVPDVQEEIVPTVEQGSQVAASRSQLDAIRDRMNNIRNQLNQNLTQGGSGGSTAGEGRPGRAARWVIRFNVRSPQDYLQQLEGLGAAIAFPISGSQLLYIHTPASNPRSEKRSIDDENRIYWVGEDEDDAEVCRILRQPLSPHILFLPEQLEQRLLELELSYNNLQENEILSTTFGVISRGGGYDVVVLSQQAK